MAKVFFQCDECNFRTEDREEMHRHLQSTLDPITSFHEVYVSPSDFRAAAPSARACALLQAAAQFFPYYEQIKQEGIDAVNSAVNSAEMLLAEIERREKKV